MTAQTIYQELTLRKKFDRARSKANDDEFLDIVDDCWETYTTIFEHENQKVKYPTLLIWEFMENFFHQFSQYHFKISGIPAEKIQTQWFNYDKTM